MGCPVTTIWILFGYVAGAPPEKATVSWPDWAKAGITATIWVEVALTTFSDIEAIDTRFWPTSVLNPLPVILMVSPTCNTVALTAVIAGTGTVIKFFFVQLL